MAYEIVYHHRLAYDVNDGGIALPVIMGTIIRVYGHEATLTVGDLALDLFVYFPDYQNIPRNLLGRQGFLQRLRFGLDDYEGIVYLSHHDDP